MLSDSDPDRSNGTCYMGKRKQAQGDLIPCGNVAYGNWPCCYSGDTCLGFQTANACYDPSTGNAYMAGCTDEYYVDKTCPQKLDFSDQEWVGILHCGTDSNGDTDWGGCKVPAEHATKLAKLANEDCDPYCATTLWIGGSEIPGFAVVPATAGGAVTWTSGFDPTSTSRPPGTLATSSATATATQDPDDISDNELSTSAKAGIGIGSAVAALLVLGVTLWLLYFCRHRKAKQSNESQQSPQAQGYTQTSQKPGGPWSPQATNSYLHPASMHSPTTMATTIVPGDGDHHHHYHHQQQQWHANANSPSPQPYWQHSGKDARSSMVAFHQNELPADEIHSVSPQGGSPPAEMMGPLFPNYSNTGPGADSTAGVVRPGGGRARDSTGSFQTSPPSAGPHSGYVGPFPSRDNDVPEMQG